MSVQRLDGWVRRKSPAVVRCQSLGCPCAVVYGATTRRFIFTASTLKGEVPRHREEPDVLGAVLPVAVGSAALFALPRDAVLYTKVPLADALHGCGTAPVAADVHRRGRFQHSTEWTEPGVDPVLVPIVRERLERAAVERLGEIVGRIHDQKVDEARGEVRERLEQVLANRSTDEVRWNGRCSQTHESLRQLDALAVAQGHRAVATGTRRISHGTLC